MPDRPTRQQGDHLRAEEDWNAVVDKAWHEHTFGDGLSVGNVAAGSRGGERREWEWAKLQADLTYGSEAEAKLYRDPDDLTYFYTVDVKAPPTWSPNDSFLSGAWVRVERHRPGVWYVVCRPTEQLQKFQIVGDHPGIDTVFDVYLGTWDPATNDYIYDCGATFKGIDHYNGVPYPSDYPTGHGLWKDSDAHGRIIDVVSLDCTGPGIDCP